MKLHRNLCDAVVDALRVIFNEGRYADKVIEHTLKEDKRRGARDRAFIAEHVYEAVRWRRLLAHGAGVGEEPPFQYGDLWAMLGVLLILRQVELPAWEEWQALDPVEVVRRRTAAEKIRPLRESVPDWLDAVGVRELGTAWDAELAALNKPAALVIRVNTLKARVPEVVARLLELGVETRGDARFPEALILSKRISLFSTDLFREGWIEVQDAASQAVAHFAQVEPGHRVVDSCAGAGGKSLHLAALMGGRGRIISLDVEEWKLEELRRRARRAGASNIEARLIEGAKSIKKLEASADRLLLDVPCSGLGVLRRNPDAKWKLDPAFLEKVRNVQREILQGHCRMVRPHGLIIYATCSLLPSEGEEQVRGFLAKNTACTLVEERRLTVAGDGFDGFYMAKIRRGSL
ncbi:MAG: RsmB/NOP family class I SAM-dependent RNA methyltransferase [Verrucomicrobiae bacterium]|nr:RsmB/NOP family class I SAM-dependent RNA methyltransferase [Verrucomicrobiae bacterium]